MKSDVLVRKLFGAALVSALTFGASVAAHAALITPNGSFAVNLDVGTITSGGSWEIGTGTSSIDVSSLEISGFNSTYLGSANNMSLAGGGIISLNDAVTLSNDTIAVKNGAVDFTMTVSDGSGDSYTFTYTDEQITSQVNGNVALYFTGDLTSQIGTGNDFTVPASADLSMSFTESAPTGTANGSATFDSPPNPPQVPEPATMAVLGVALAGLAAARRKRI